MKKKYLQLLSLLFLVALTSTLKAQVFSDKDVSKEQRHKEDSLMAKKVYPYILPIWGQKATDRGYTLPYSAGLGVNYIYQKSDLIINNLNVGFNNRGMYNMDGIVRFNDATATSMGINIRPDVWVLPFLNIYGILAKSNSSTAVDVDIVVPDGSGNGTGETTVMSMSTKANFQGSTMGFGMTPTMGVGGFWMALDMNCTWTDIDALSKPAFIYVFGPRMGKSFKLKKKDQSLTFWAGGFRVKMNSGTEGSLPVGDLINTDGIDAKIDNAYVRLEQAQTDLDAWWNSLDANQQKIYQGVYDRGNAAIDRATGVISDLDNAVTNNVDNSVQYSLNKKPKDMWNFVVGGQYQVSRHLMFRAEYGFLGSRQQFIGMIQYRFGL